MVVVVVARRGVSFNTNSRHQSCGVMTLWPSRVTVTHRGCSWPLSEPHWRWRFTGWCCYQGLQGLLWQLGRLPLGPLRQMLPWSLGWWKCSWQRRGQLGGGSCY